jgi:hypothetical protein
VYFSIAGSAFVVMSFVFYFKIAKIVILQEFGKLEIEIIYTCK